MIAPVTPEQLDQQPCGMGAGLGWVAADEKASEPICGCSETDVVHAHAFWRFMMLPSGATLDVQGHGQACGQMTGQFDDLAHNGHS